MSFAWHGSLLRLLQDGVSFLYTTITPLPMCRCFLITAQSPVSISLQPGGGICTAVGSGFSEICLYFRKGCTDFGCVFQFFPKIKESRLLGVFRQAQTDFTSLSNSLIASKTSCLFWKLRIKSRSPYHQLRDTISTIYCAVCLGCHLKLGMFHRRHRDGGKGCMPTSFHSSHSGFASRHRTFCLYFLLYLVFSLHPGVPFLVSAPTTVVVKVLQSVLPRIGSAIAWRKSQAGLVPAASVVEGDGQRQRSWLSTQLQL